VGGHSGGPSAAGVGAVEWRAGVPLVVNEGDEHAFSFFFRIEPTVYRAPGEDNLILRFVGDDEQPSFGLQLWDDDSGEGRGLWSSGEAMGGERFLAPLAEGAWHQVVLHFLASSADDGFYLLVLDGVPIDARGWVSLIGAEGASAQLEAGLFRAGERVIGASDIVFGPAKLAARLESVIP
jgi:hypothetical protein